MTTDDLSRDLEAIQVPSIPNDYASLKALIQTLPSPLLPEVRSAISGWLNTASPTLTAAQQTTSALSGAPIGQESGATIGVVSELFYGSSNLLNNPAIEGIFGATITTTQTRFAPGWDCAYVLNSGTAPSSNLQIDATYGRSSRANNPLNSVMSGLYFPNTAATDYTVNVRSYNAVGSGYDSELPFLVASVKVGRWNDVNSAGITKMRVRMEILVSGTPTVGPWFDMLELSATGRIARLSIAVPRPGGGWWANTYRWRLVVEISRANSTGSDYMFWGEPVLALSSSQSPVPYTPMLAGWVPNYVSSQQPADSNARLYVGPSPTGKGAIELGPGTGLPDVRMSRTGTGRLVFDGDGQSVATEVAIEATSGQRAKFDARVAGDTESRAQLWGDATKQALEFSPGNTSVDTNLYRAQADVLKTDDQFVAVGGLTLKTVAGAVSDADFVLDQSGNMALDTTNSRLYIRVGATWKYVNLI